MDHHAIHVKCIPEAMGIGGAGELYGEADIAMKEFSSVRRASLLSEASVRKSVSVESLVVGRELESRVSRHLLYICIFSQKRRQNNNIK